MHKGGLEGGKNLVEDDNECVSIKRTGCPLPGRAPGPLLISQTAQSPLPSPLAPQTAEKGSELSASPRETRNGLAECISPDVHPLIPATLPITGSLLPAHFPGQETLWREFFSLHHRLPLRQHYSGKPFGILFPC